MEEAELVLVGLALLGGAVVGAWVVWALSQQALGALPQQPLGTVTPKATYRNLEEWIVKRDETGRIVGVDIHRKVERTG